MRTDAPQPEDQTPIVRLVELCKSFGPLAVLKSIDLEFASGKTTVVLGPSGCGKTVMLKHVIGLLKPDSGQVWFEDTRVDPLSERRLGPIRRQFGVLFQQGALFDSMSVRDNVGFPVLEHTRLNAAERRAEIMRVLEMVGMTESVDKMPADLSGGQRKRVALARAIILRPKVVLYDEPTTGLDPIRADVINELILKLQRELRVTSIVVTHDMASAFRIGDVMVMLHEGRVITSGSPQQLRDSDEPIVRRFLHAAAGNGALEHDGEP